MLTVEILASTQVSDDVTAVTPLALALDRAMANDASARAAYLATWGVEWMPLTITDTKIAHAYNDASRTCAL